MIILGVLWILWCALHSLLISRAAHDIAKKILGRRFPLYRFLYVGFSLITLVPVLWYQFTLPQQVIIPGTRLLRIGQGVLLVYAGFMFYAGARVYDMGYFIGLRQWRSLRQQKKTGSLPFHTDGILAYVRHPWYGGGIAFLWGAGSITDVFLLTRTILTFYIILGAFLEENRLKSELGQQYRAYCREVPMLVPWKKPPALKGKRKSS
ncbi:MAG: hypothetical protein M8357_03185 [Desulfobulbaceae bacterium]|nr:hypothetical protein [Desulfobulbaceae bacterium]